MSITKKPVPTGRPRYIGIELEFDLASHSELDVLRERLRAVLKPDTWTCQYEHLTNDSRLANQLGRSEYGYEFTLLSKQSEFFTDCLCATQFEIAMAIISATPGVFVDNRCGLHIHLDARATPASTLKARLTPDLPMLIDKFAGDWRKANPSCWDPAPLWVRGRYETLEVRIMPATFNVELIQEFTGKICRRAYKSP